MKSRLLSAMLSAAVVATALPSAVAADTYAIDPGHSQVRFSYSHFGFSNITGIFGGVEGELVYDPDNPTRASVLARIPISAVRTGTDKLDAHLQRDDFFDATAFPLATFQSTAVEVLGDGRLRVSGDLVIRDVSQPISLDVQLNQAGPHPMSKQPAIGFDARTTLTRSDFGLGKYAPAVGDEVAIEITIEAQQPKQD
jgi:polyisoprenoid-binding protein YceI